MKKIPIALLCALGTAACTHGRANFYSEGTPGASSLQGTPISIEVPATASPLEQNYAAIVDHTIRQHPELGFRMASDRKYAGAFLRVNAGRGNQTVGYSSGPRPLFLLGALQTEAVEEDRITMTLSMVRADTGHVVWEGGMTGSADYLTGKEAPDCVRALLDWYPESRSEIGGYCYW